MLPRLHRLSAPADFRRTTRGGVRSGTRTLVVHLLVGGEGGTAADAPARAGFVVSKAVGSAVIRNRVKRRLRHLVRDRLEAIPTSGLLVVRALPAAGTASYADLAADLDRALARCLARVAA